MRKGLSSEERELLNSPQDVRGATNALENTSSITGDSAASAPTDGPTPELSDLHREFAKSLAKVLSDCAGRETLVSLRHDGLGTYAQFVFGQPVPCCCAILESEASQFEFYLAMSPSILYPFLDRLVGARESDPIPQRPMTEIEQGLVEVLLAQIIAEYEDAWRPTLSLKLNLNRLEHNLLQRQLLSGNDATYRARYDVRFENFSGFIELCLPWESTRQLRQRLNDR